MKKNEHHIRLLQVMREAINPRASTINMLKAKALDAAIHALAIEQEDKGAEDRNWIEDLVHENGNYMCRCCECGSTFQGYKRRVVCKVCSTNPRAELLTLAENCGAQITGKPDASEPITVTFTIQAWRAFDAALVEKPKAEEPRAEERTIKAQDIDANDLKVDIYCIPARGFGYPTEGVRITHIPTGIIAKSHDARGQHRNRAVAMQILSDRLQELYNADTDVLREEKRTTPLQDIDELELKVEFYRVTPTINCAETAVRITHIPTGLVAYSQDERGKIRNKAVAMDLLRNSLQELYDARTNNLQGKK